MSENNNRVKTTNDIELKDRLVGRGTDSEEVIQTRLQNSLKELEYEKFYDLTVINHEVNEAVEELKNIISKKGRV